MVERRCEAPRVGGSSPPCSIGRRDEQNSGACTVRAFGAPILTPSLVRTEARASYSQEEGLGVGVGIRNPCRLMPLLDAWGSRSAWSTGCVTERPKASEASVTPALSERKRAGRMEASLQPSGPPRSLIRKPHYESAHSYGMGTSLRPAGSGMQGKDGMGRARVAGNSHSRDRGRAGGRR